MGVADINHTLFMTLHIELLLAKLLEITTGSRPKFFVLFLAPFAFWQNFIDPVLLVSHISLMPIVSIDYQQL